MENSVSLLDSIIYTIELTVSENKRPEVLKAKYREVRNLEDYNIFEELYMMNKRQLVANGSSHKRRNTMARRMNTKRGW